MGAKWRRPLCLGGLPNPFQSLVVGSAPLAAPSVVSCTGPLGTAGHSIDVFGNCYPLYSLRLREIQSAAGH